jgi:UDP-N-acetylglucosamine 2-epimerase (non-hydrolysing)
VQEITYASKTFYDDIAQSKDSHVHLILIATKPDIIKQVPLYKELKKRGHLVVLGHTGQHYDENLSGGMLKEFGVEPDFNLNVRGAMHEVVSQIIGRLGYVMGELKEKGKAVIPYVHGDTTTAMAASNAGYCHGFASVHVEAGIRTLTPRKDLFDDFIRMVETEGEPIVARFFEQLRERGNWDRGSLEPYPEQFNTRCSEAATGIHLAPVELDEDFMLMEGFPRDRIFVVGNSVTDATEEALKNAKKATVFEKYPILKDGDFVRFCIHRGENCISERRFRAIYEAMKSLIVEGKKVLLISLYKTEAAFERFGLAEEVKKLDSEHENFVYSPVWPQYTDVIAAMSKAAVCATDSGSVQEEMNVLGVPCVTLRFGSDRSESIMAGGNIIAPPVSGGLIRTVIDYAWNRADMKSAPKIYGKDVSKKCIDTVEDVLKNGEVFRDEEARLHI